MSAMTVGAPVDACAFLLILFLDAAPYALVVDLLDPPAPARVHNAFAFLAQHSQDTWDGCAILSSCFISAKSESAAATTFQMRACVETFEANLGYRLVPRAALGQTPRTSEILIKIHVQPTLLDTRTGREDASPAPHDVRWLASEAAVGGAGRDRMVRILAVLSARSCLGKVGEVVGEVWFAQVLGGLLARWVGLDECW